MPEGMKFKVEVDLHGLEEDLIRLGPKVAKRLFRRALKMVGELWKEALKSKVPVGNPATAKQGSDYSPGALRDSIDYVISTGKGDHGGTVTVGPTYDKTAAKAAKDKGDTSTLPGVYGKFVEFGLHVKQYPFHPFMRPTFDTTAESMIEIFADGLREDLEDAVK